MLIHSIIWRAWSCSSIQAHLSAPNSLRLQWVWLLSLTQPHREVPEQYNSGNKNTKHYQSAWENCHKYSDVHRYLSGKHPADLARHALPGAPERVLEVVAADAVWVPVGEQQLDSNIGAPAPRALQLPPQCGHVHTGTCALGIPFLQLRPVVPRDEIGGPGRVRHEPRARAASHLPDSLFTAKFGNLTPTEVDRSVMMVKRLVPFLFLRMVLFLNFQTDWKKSAQITKLNMNLFWWCNKYLRYASVIMVL